MSPVYNADGPYQGRISSASPWRAPARLLPSVHPDAKTTIMPVVPQEAPRRQRRWQDYSLLIGMALGLVMLPAFLNLVGL